MRIACIGGGPAGLYLSILMKKANPAHEITVYERNRPDDTFGWGVVFSDATMGNFRRPTRRATRRSSRAFHHWDDIDVYFKGRKITSRRPRLLRHRPPEAAQHPAGARCRTRREAGLRGRNRRRPDAYACRRRPGDRRRRRALGARKQARGALQPAHRRSATAGSSGSAPISSSTPSPSRSASPPVVLVPARLPLRRRDVDLHRRDARGDLAAAGLDALDHAGRSRCARRCSPKLLDGNRLMSNARHLRGSAVWLNFNRVLCERWYKDNIVLIGDAAHTAHFSIGSGTKLAMEDAIALAAVLQRPPTATSPPAGALPGRARGRGAQAAERGAQPHEWFEHVDRYVHLPPQQFVFSLLTGSQRVGHANQRLRDKAYVDSASRRAGGAERPAGRSRGRRCSRRSRCAN
jgi:anthraniloyl-CoA monooxygenase